jgi:hypothetical protein
MLVHRVLHTNFLKCNVYAQIYVSINGNKYKWILFQLQRHKIQNVRRRIKVKLDFVETFNMQNDGKKSKMARHSSHIEFIAY